MIQEKDSKYSVVRM